MLRRALTLFLGLATGGVLGLAWVVDRFGQRDERRRAGAIVVLGARVLPGGVASSALRARVAHGVELFRQGLAPVLLFSGGVGGSPPAEALVSRALAVAAGVPEGACAVETESLTTAQNARFSARLLGERGVKEILLVTDGYHLLRASRYFRKERLRVHVSPAVRDPGVFPWRDRLYWTLREALAFVISPRLWWVD